MSYSNIYRMKIQININLYCIISIYFIWMWIDWCRKYQPAEPEYEICWWVSEANESPASHSVEQADILQYQSYSHLDDTWFILKSNINTNTTIFVFLREKSHDSKYSKYASPKHSSYVACKYTINFYMYI